MIVKLFKWYDVVENQRRLLIGIFIVTVILAAYSIYRDHGLSIRLASSLGLLAGAIGGFTLGQRAPLSEVEATKRNVALYSPLILLVIMIGYSYSLNALRDMSVVFQLSFAVIVGAIFTASVTYARRARVTL